MRVFILTILSCIFLKNSVCQITNSGRLKGILNEFKSAYENEKYGLVALEYRDGVLDTTSIGWAGKNIPMCAHKVFNIGSLTKTFTAVLILKLVESGELSLSDPIGKFFPIKKGLDEHLNPQITIDQLLTHYSGLREILVDTILNSYLTRKPVSIQSRFPLLANTAAPPGSTYKYCNSNYIVLGYLLEKINQMPYGQLLQIQILEPCNIKRKEVWFDPRGKESAHPIFKGKDLSKMTKKDLYSDFSFSAGGLGFNLLEVYSFFKALLVERTILNNETLALMTQNEDSIIRGLYSFDKKNAQNSSIYYGHGGDNFSYKCRNFINPDNGHFVILLSNQYKDSLMDKVINDIFNSY